MFNPGKEMLAKVYVHVSMFGPAVYNRLPL